MFEHDPDWVAPVLWRSEFRNILARYLRRGNLTFLQAYNLQCEAEDLLAGAEYEVNSLSILKLVRDSECSAHDCEFVALAMKLGAKLVTMDSKLLRAFPGIAFALSMS
ncbi:type II toxin-antitoxin system VapC family toxin [uncultured Nitrosomonas sp.]|uniref:type II toxin-antitoxin system VapC family toxin n=1 Tax=uncultured Nitrosomonas sp. TaxID=156424 RepID=UPI00261309B5|nr:type II toxin-antitoxin system VapC family toxin [uncultured Nitrosomonas sp.]